MPGISTVTEQDVIRKEVIQLLCIEPMSNSALNMALTENTNHETGLEQVIDQVANFKKPTGAKGKVRPGLPNLKSKYYLVQGD